MGAGVAVLTSGGDAPGMNAALRAVVRTGITRGFEMFGVHDGYAGLISGRISQLTARDVGGIIQSAGTMLGAPRSPQFMTATGQQDAMGLMQERHIQPVIVTGRY